ncbi:minor capsid protein [Micromonospora sp. NPDC048930]|uniref:minor capsid protein n=1 Tax=Micromonospora sp. NPDC048930 TaxID=3364261 RepID=UPI003717A2B9
MATGDGWTSRLLTGLAEHLAAASVGDWNAAGLYTDDQTGIFIRAVPPSPNRIITLAAYPVGTELQGMADHLTGVQIRVRGIPGSPQDCDDLADAIFDELDSLTGVTWGGIPVKQVWRQSYTSLGQDNNSRWERSENYYIDTMRPTAHRTD